MNTPLHYRWGIWAQGDKGECLVIGRAITEVQDLTTRSILVIAMQDFIDGSRKWEGNNSG